MTNLPISYAGRRFLITASLLALSALAPLRMAHAAPLAASSLSIKCDVGIFAPARSPLRPNPYPILRVPPYVPRSVVADPWAFPIHGFAVENVLSDAVEFCSIEESTDAISGRIPKNLRCARSVSYLLHRAFPAFRGHDRAETCARRIQATFGAKRSRVYILQDQLENAPDGYLYVICLLHSSKSRVAHIAFYDPDTKGVLGNAMGKWKSQPLETYWHKYHAYYLLGIPRANPVPTLQN